MKGEGGVYCRYRGDKGGCKRLKSKGLERERSKMKVEEKGGRVKV